MNPQQLRAFFTENETRPKKKLGQNFLVNPAVLPIILDAAALSERDRVIEIGAGLGYLTAALAERAEHLIAVEVDTLLYKTLAARFGAPQDTQQAAHTPLYPHVHLINADILKLEFATLLSEETQATAPVVKVIANLPYNITTPILWRLLEHHTALRCCVLMMQREVAERIVAPPGGKEYGALTIGVAYHAEASLIATLAPENFYPAPKVDSAILRLTMRQTPKVQVENEELFFLVVRAAFRMRRKMLKNALANGRIASPAVLNTAFSASGIAPERRAETLDIAEFAALTNRLAALSDSEHP